MPELTLCTLSAGLELMDASGVSENTASRPVLQACGHRWCAQNRARLGFT